MTDKVVCRKPHVTAGAIVLKDKKVLMGKRKGGLGDGTWGFPGGRLEFGEDIIDCVHREVMEEVGIRIKNLRFGTFTNDYFQKEGLHYVSIYFVADYDSGNVKVMEPDKCSEWRWVEWDKMPRPLFLHAQNLLKQKFDLFKV